VGKLPEDFHKAITLLRKGQKEGIHSALVALGYHRGLCVDPKGWKNGPLNPRLIRTTTSPFSSRHPTFARNWGNRTYSNRAGASLSGFYLKRFSKSIQNAAEN
jgi:hypothetical protein